MSLTLYGFLHPENARNFKPLVVAAFANVHVDVKNLVYAVDNEKPEYFRNCHPLGRAPVLQTEEGYLFETGAITRYIARQDKSFTFIYGRTPFETAQCDMWLDFTVTEIDPVVSQYIGVLFGFPSSPAPGTDEKLNCMLTGLESWLEIRTFLVGERITVADISVVIGLQWLFRAHPDADALAKKYKNVWRLYNTVMQQPKTVEVLKQHGATFGLRPKEAPKKEEKPKEEKPKKEEKKPAKEDDDEEEETFEEKKKPNPLDSLPPSNFVLDAFKREYSNTDTRTVAAPYFFANFDAAGYSAFWCRYKYNEDNKMQFMTANLIRGWFQRMEHTRKYAFGVALIIGEEKKHEVVAFWVFRGKGMPQIVLDVEDTELFDWTEIPDIKAEQVKITDYLCWEGASIGKPVLEGKCFK